MTAKNRVEKETGPKGTEAIEGIFDGLTSLLGRIKEIAEKGETIQRSGEIHGLGDGAKGVYGFSFRVGIGGGQEKIHVEPFGNVRKNTKTGESVVQEIREPVTDIFEEEDHILVVAEMPGVGPGDIDVDVSDDVLTITAEKGDKKYRKEILLPRSVMKSKMSVMCNNGVAELKFPK